MTARELDRFYESSKWRKTRARILRRDGYQCQLSRRYGKVIPAEIVHHIFPREYFPEYEYADWNLIALSRSKHNELHDRNTNELTQEGINLLERTARREGIPIPARYRRSKHGKH